MSSFARELRRPARWGAVLTFLGSFLLIAWHPAHLRMWRTLWAEDGQIFLHCQQRHNVLSCLTTAYGGYLHAGPRILITPVSLFPVSWWPVVTCGIALTFDALALTLVFATTRWLIPSLVVRGLTTAVAALSAAAHWEAAGNLTNLHWFLLVSGIVVAVNPEASAALVPTVLRGVWLALCCGSEALAPIIVVAYVMGLVLRRRARGRLEPSDVVLGSVAAIIALIQVVVQIRHPRPGSPLPRPGLSDMWRDYRLWIVRYSWHASEASSATVRTYVLIVVAILLVVGVLVRAVGRSLGEGGLQLVAGTLLVIGSFAEFGVSEYVNRSVSPRYVFAPFVLALFGVVTVLSSTREVLARRPVALRRATSAVLGVGLAALIGALVVIGPYPPRAATQGLTWRAEVDKARTRCHQQHLDSAQIIIAPYSPRAAYFFYATVPCERL